MNLLLTQTRPNQWARVLQLHTMPQRRRSTLTMTSGTSFLYFAYGSNLWSERIRLNNRTAILKSVGLLQGYRLEFAYMSQRWKGAAANIFPDPASSVYGVLWELQIDDMKSLNKQEGVDDGIYERLEIQVESSGKTVDCSVYKLTEACRAQSMATHGAEKLKPSTVYKNVIIKGAKENNLPPEYISFLENVPCNGYTGEVEVNLPLTQQ